MYRTDAFYIGFSDIVVKLTPPEQGLQLSRELKELLLPEPPAQPADARYRIVLLDHPLPEEDAPVYTYSGIRLYRTEEGWLRIHPLRCSENGCQVACLLRFEGEHTLYYPAQMWDHYANPLHCAHLLGLETVLIKRNAFLLHSSVVMYEGKTVLFCGPSGVGKSTQAQLWQDHLGATVLNGDRCVIMEKDGIFYGGGSPLAGSSNIYHPEQAPIAAIFLPEHAPENRVSRLGFAALAPLMSQTLLNSWDSRFMEQLAELYQNLLAQVPIYRLSCRPDRQAVILAKEALENL